jgi:hypothetical protein
LILLTSKQCAIGGGNSKRYLRKFSLEMEAKVFGYFLISMGAVRFRH